MPVAVRLAADHVRMKVSELIDFLAATNQGVDAYVYVRDQQGRLWDVGVETSRVNSHGPAPYSYDTNGMNAKILIAESSRDDDADT